MQFDVSFVVPMPPEQAWPLLLDVRRIAPCLPGAELTDVLGDNRYKGRARVKVGPIELSFAGEAELRDIDNQAHTASVVARGAEGKGRGNAAATVRFQLSPDAAGTKVVAITDLQLVGAVAQYGRGAGLIKEIANQLTQQFARNLQASIAAEQSAAPAPTAESAPASATMPNAAAAPPPPPAAIMPPPPVQAVSGLSLVWAALRAMVARWFGRG